MKSLEKKIKLTGTALGLLFALLTICLLIGNGQADRLALAIGTVFLAMLPAAVEKVFRCRISLAG